jgi:hypothetical protein
MKVRAGYDDRGIFEETRPHLQYDANGENIPVTPWNVPVFWAILLVLGAPLMAFAMYLYLGSSVLEFIHSGWITFGIFVASAIIYALLHARLLPYLNQWQLFKSLRPELGFSTAWRQVSYGGYKAAVRELIFLYSLALLTGVLIGSLFWFNEHVNSATDAGVYKLSRSEVIQGRRNTYVENDYVNLASGEKIMLFGDTRFDLVAAAKACLEIEVLQGGLALDRVTRVETVECTQPAAVAAAVQQTKSGRYKPTHLGQVGDFRIAQFATNDRDRLVREWLDAKTGAPNLSTTTRIAFGETLYAGFFFNGCTVGEDDSCDLAAEYMFVFNPDAGEDGIVRMKIDDCCKMKDPGENAMGLFEQLFRLPIETDIPPGSYEMYVFVTDRISNAVIETSQVIEIVEKR